MEARQGLSLTGSLPWASCFLLNSVWEQRNNFLHACHCSPVGQSSLQPTAGALM